MSRWVLLTCAALRALPLAAQEPADTAAADTLLLRVFLDCQGYVPGCDFDFFRTEITFVNYVRDRQVADVHVLVTTQPTGGGGREFTLTFMGLRRFAGGADTLRHVSAETATDDEIRRGLARVLRLGLVRYAAQTPLASRIDVSVTAPPGGTAPVDDPWNHWVFRTRFSGNFFGEESSTFAFVNVSQSVDRVTDRWKLGLRVSWSHDERAFKVPVFDSTGQETGSETIRTIRRSYSGNALIARSLGPRWSIGWRLRAGHSTFLNQDMALVVAPMIEFDVYPYAQSTRRLLALRYEIGLDVNDYRDTTVYNRLKETLAHQLVSATVDFKQPWGSVELALEAQHFLRDLDLHHVTLFGELELRVFRGLSVNLFGRASRVKDRISVAKAAGSTPDEILLQRRQLDTDFEFFSFVGLTFRFGSVYDNVVNPRFGGID